eukprot:scaffold11494_cov41-Phaeocystis_antarctica.AAC.3
MSHDVPLIGNGDVFSYEDVDQARYLVITPTTRVLVCGTLPSYHPTHPRVFSYEDVDQARYLVITQYHPTHDVDQALHPTPTPCPKPYPTPNP